MSKNFVHKVDKIVGKFLWTQSGKVLRVSMEDVKNSKERGGMGLICLTSMGQSLFLSQFLRLLRNGDRKSIGHVWYWIGEILGDLLPDWDPSHTRNSQTVPQYFESLAHKLIQAKMSETVTESNWRQITNKLKSKY